MTKNKSTKLKPRRDGSSFLGLASWLDEVDRDLSDLTSRVRLARMHEGEHYHKSRMRTLGKTLSKLEGTITELLATLPEGDERSRNSESRFVCMGLIAQWLDQESQKYRSVQGGIHGSSESFEIPKVLEFLATQRKTGMFKVLAAEETFYLELAEGEVVHAASDNAPVGERLGEVLVELEVLTREKLQAIVGAHGRPRNRIGDELIQRGWVTEKQLLGALQVQVRRILNRLCRSGEALFEFHEDATQRSRARVRIPTLPMLLEIATETDSQAKDKADQLASAAQAEKEPRPA